MVEVGVSVEIIVVVSIGKAIGPEQAARTRPQTDSHRFRIRLARMVSFIVSKTGRIVTQGVVQSN